MSIATALAALDTQRDNLAANLTTKGVTASNTETLAQLVPKVLDIESGGGYDTSDATATAAPYRDWETDRKSTRLNSSHSGESRMPSSA